MKLQISTRLALYAVLQLAADPRKQFAADIADRFGVSVNHLSKVLRTLGRAGLLEAVRGAGGGYRFRGNARRITLLDVIQLFEEVDSNGRAEDAPGAATDEGRALHRVLAEVGDIARATLSSITIATMLKIMEEPPAAAQGTAAAPAGRRRSAGFERA